MNFRLLTPAMATLIAFGGCASNPSDPLVARRKSYQRLTSFLEPGMTRRQVYALLPPSQKPMVQFPYFIGGVLSSRTCPMSMEWYPLDSIFSLQASYRLANPREYPVTPSRKPSANPTPKEIDALLFPRLIPSRQNPNDVLLERPHVFTHANSGTFHVPQ